MSQIMELGLYEDETLTIRLIPKGTDTIVYTSGPITGKDNDSTQYRDSGIPDSLNGAHRVSALGLDGLVAFAGWVDLQGVAGAEHEADESYSLLMAMRMEAPSQVIEFPNIEDMALVIRLFNQYTDSIAYTSGVLMSKTNDTTQYRDGMVPTTLYGFYRVSAVAVDGGDVVYTGWVDLTGKEGAVHECEDSLPILLALRQKKRGRGVPRAVHRSGNRPRYSLVSSY